MRNRRDTANLHDDASQSSSFEALASANFDAAYNLARWLTRDPLLAQDVVQDAMLRALTYFAGFRGDNPRAWLLKIVRNVAWTSLARQKEPVLRMDPGDLAEGSPDLPEGLVDPRDGPEAAALHAETRSSVGECLATLPPELRECLVLREWEELSYKEIARIIDAPIGTVMSRLWRARRLLAQLLAAELEIKP